MSILQKRTTVINNNDGVNKVTKKGTFGNIENVWYDPRSLVNILSLGKLAKPHQITMGTAKENKFVVHCKNGKCIEFKMASEGLYYHDMAAEKDKHTSLVTTVRKNMEIEGYTCCQVERAKNAREMMKLLGFLSEDDFKWMVCTGVIRNCPVNVEDIQKSPLTYSVPTSIHSKGKQRRGNHQQ